MILAGSIYLIKLISDQMVSESFPLVELIHDVFKHIQYCENIIFLVVSLE